MQVTTGRKLAELTSLRVGGPAEELVQLKPGDDLAQAVAERSNGSLWVLGYGTNSLISDRGLPGTVIIDQAGRIEQLGPARFKVGSGGLWDEFMQELIRRGLWGLEFASGIPGGVGAAVVGNIAAYGHKVADALVEATILDPRAGLTKVWSRDELELTYRASALQRPEHRHLVVLDATFELSPEPTSELGYDSALRVAGEINVQPDTLEHRRQIILTTRRRAGSLLIDGEPGQAGSFFKNPIVPMDMVDHILSFEETDIGREKLKHQTVLHGGDNARVPAALVLLAAGFQRGQQWGNVRLHPRQILKIENLGGATAAEIYDVAQSIMAAVKQKLGIPLEPEVRFLGEF